MEEIYATVPLNQKAIPESPKISVSEPLGSQKAVPEPFKVKASEPLNPQKAVPASPGLLASEPLVEESDPPFCRIQANRSTHCLWLRSGVLDDIGEEVWCAASFTYSQKIAEDAHKAKLPQTLEEMIPAHYRKHAVVFSEQESE